MVVSIHLLNISEIISHSLLSSNQIDIYLTDIYYKSGEKKNNKTRSVHMQTLLNIYVYNFFSSLYPFRFISK